MGVFAGPEITESGLVLALDAANNKSILSAVEVLVVAGGGAGGNGTGYGYESGGGGAGGLIYSSSHSITPGSAITATIGGGGASATSLTPGTNGSNSVFGSLTAIGGGGGASSPAGGSSGGSGGGGSHSGTAGGSGTAGQGFSGATPVQSSSGGGGGGAGGPGKSTSSNADGSGGIGLPFSISGSLQYYAGGGGGSRHTNVSGGLGGGGAGVSLSAGYANGSPGGTNTGGGGGGANQPATSTGGGAGGSGIIIVRYPGSQRATGGTVTSVGGYTIHTFTTSGTFTPNFGDMSGNGNTGELVNGVGYSSSNRGSLTFDGSNQRVSTNYKPSGERSYFIWVKFSSLTHSSGYQVTGTQQSNAFTYIGIENGGDVYYYAGADTGGNIGNPVTVNTWVNLGFALFPDGSRRVYKNGIEIHYNTGGLGGTATLEFSVGCINQNYFITGNIAQVSIYNRALSAAEIQQNFNATRSRYGI